MFQRSFARVASPLAIALVVIAVVTVAASPQGKEKARTPLPSIEKPQSLPTNQPSQPVRVVSSLVQAKAAIDKMLDSYDLKPHPLPLIPDDPPPHEGAMISLPHIVEPPDLVLVEVLEALPGRPISGERLVRPDDTIDLGFYGELHVGGLTHQQIEVAVIKHLRKHLSDETLGLIVSVYGEAEPPPAAEPAKAPPKPELPPGGENIFKEFEKPRASSDSPRSTETRRILRKGGRHPIAVQLVRTGSLRVVSREQEEPPSAKTPLKIDANGKGRVTITIEIEGGRPLPLPLPQPEPAEPSPPPALEDEGPWRIVPIEENDRVFVDITAYNSKN